MDSKKNKKYNPCIVPVSLVKACARGLQSGLDKGYRPKSYLDGDIGVYQNALYRHLLSYIDGNLVDSESGLDTLDHIVANVAILIELERTKGKSREVKLPKQKLPKIKYEVGTIGFRYENGKMEVNEIFSERKEPTKGSEHVPINYFLVDVIKSFDYNNEEYMGMCLDCRNIFFGGYEVLIDGNWIAIDKEVIKRR